MTSHPDNRQPRQSLPFDVGAEAFGRLVGDFDAVLQHGHGEVVGGVGGEPQTEVRVGVVRGQVLAHLPAARSLSADAGWGTLSSATWTAG